jgi:Carboxypeptidase regulatory-like domain
MNVVKILILAVLLFTPLAVAQHNDSSPDSQPNVFLENNRPKNAKESNTRTIEGSVKDAADNPLADAIVQLKNLKTSKIVDYPTREDGKFSFRDLPMDVNFELVAKHGQLTAPAKKVTIYDTRKYVLLNFQLTSAKP